MSTQFTKKIAPLFAAVVMACAGTAQARSPLDGSIDASDNGAPLLGTYALTVGAAGSSPSAAWTGFGSVGNLSAPTSSGVSAWRVSGNPFGDAAATKLVFTAVGSNQCQTAGSCNSQPDSVVAAVHAMPEPETYALLAAGLGAVGFLARRRRER